MSKKANRKIILINGIRDYANKHDTCRKYFSWKNRKGRGAIPPMRKAVQGSRAGKASAQTRQL